MSQKRIQELFKESDLIYVSSVLVSILVYYFTDNLFRYIVLLMPLIFLLWLFKIHNISNKLLWVLAFSLQGAVITCDMKANYFGSIGINITSIPELFLSCVSHGIIIWVMNEEKMIEKTTRLQLFFRFIPFEIISSIICIYFFIPYLPFSYFFPMIIAFSTLLTIKYYALRRVTNQESYALVVISVIALLLINYTWFIIQFMFRSPVVSLILHLSNYCTIYCFVIGMKLGNEISIKNLNQRRYI